MSLFFHQLVRSRDDNVNVCLRWHECHSLVAIGYYYEPTVSSVDVVTVSGNSLNHNIVIKHVGAVITCLTWHPKEKILLAGFEDGEIYLSDNATAAVKISSHHASIHLLLFSKRGSRLLSADTNGSVICWRFGHESIRLVAMFHHELKENICGLVFCASSEPLATDISKLARAAVAGNEQALDMFNTWDKKILSGNENLNAYAGSISGVIYYLNENGTCVEVLKAESSVKCLLNLVVDGEDDDVLVIVTESMVIGQFKTTDVADGNLQELNKVKLSTQSKYNQIECVGASILAISTGDCNIRIWNLANNENFVLDTTCSTVKTTKTEYITCLSFNASKNILAAGTNVGGVLLWRKSDGYVGSDISTGWSSLPRLNMEGIIKEVDWDCSGILCVNTGEQIFILREKNISAIYVDGMAVVQTDATNMSVMFYDKSSSSVAASQTNLSVEFNVIGLRCSETNLVVWSTSKIVVYNVERDLRHFMKHSEFDLEIGWLELHESNLYTIENSGRLCVRSFQGTIKQMLGFSVETDGVCVTSNLSGIFLIIGTSLGIIHVWDLSKRDARHLHHPIDAKNAVPHFSALISVKCNIKGTYISVMARSTVLPNSPTNTIFVFDVEHFIWRYYEFDELATKSPPPNVVIDHGWDAREPNLLVCSSKHQQMYCLVSFFLHEEFGIVLHNVQPVNAESDEFVRIIAVDIPHVVALRRNTMSSSLSVKMYVMKDFSGLDGDAEVDETARKAIVKFSFHLSTGNMDEAFKAIKRVKSSHVWRNMAKMCVKTQRIDVAMICLGNMGHSYGARALRLALASEKDIDVQVGVLAVYLDMPEEAEQKFISAGRYDLVNRLFQTSNKWDKALDIAEKNDRIHLRATHYNLAQHLEDTNQDVTGAIYHYQRSCTDKFEIPRMLIDDFNALEAYIISANDETMNRWWAQYMESSGEIDTALQFYDMAHDYLSLVRVNCYCDNITEAARIATVSNDRAACYHLARQYENGSGVIEEAIELFVKARSYSNAIRLCRENGFDERLWTLALLSTSIKDKLEAAKYFETSDRPNYDRAVILYEKGGYLAKALDLAFQTNRHHVLQFISSNLDDNTDPALLTKTADFFLENAQFEKAVTLFAASGQCERALQLCIEHNVIVTNELAEKLCRSDSEKKSSLNALAEVCFRQGNYHLATKKWTQAGNRIQAMKSLLKSGDTEKIIFFANVSRSKEIFILAANYLQTLDWRNDADIVKNIVSYYTKSGAYESLAIFYESSAEVEIDEYQNYEKALSAFTQCLGCLNKMSPPPSVILDRISQNIEGISQFVECRKMYTNNPNQAVEGCKSLLNAETRGVRQGDVYGFLIEHYARNENLKLAQHYIQELKNTIKNVNVAYYVEPSILESIEKVKSGLLL